MIMGGEIEAIIHAKKEIMISAVNDDACKYR